MSSITDLPYQEEQVAIESGDALIMLKPGGDINVMTLGIDQDLMNGLYGREIQTFTTEEKDVYDRGEALFLLTMAYKSPEIMELLRRVAASEGDTQQQKLNNVVTLH